MVFQYARRCRWLLWLSGALVLSSLASTKAVSSFRHYLGAANEDQLNRQLSVDNSRVLTFNSIHEERSLLPLPSQLSDAIALCDKLLGTSKDYKGYMKELLSQFEKETIAEKHAISQLRQLFPDPAGDFWDVTVQGEFSGLQLLQHFQKIGVPDDNIIEMMAVGGSNDRNMLNDDSMLSTWILFSNGRELDLDSWNLLLTSVNAVAKIDRNMLRFFLRVSEMSANPDVRNAALEHANGLLDHFYCTGKWVQKEFVKGVHITGNEVGMMEDLLRRYDEFAASMTADEFVLRKIAFTWNKERANLLENQLFEKWSVNSIRPTFDEGALRPEEKEVLKRIIGRLAAAGSVETL